ncbi:MAG: hypothetical protein IIW48_10950, partial [Clostridia bacterium]|nr:hypothetical protein [Clostridia bacterium]
MTFNVRETRVKISFFFFVAVCFALVLDTTDTAALALCAAVIHETGHLLCMLLYGERPSEVFLAPFGMSITRLSCGGCRKEIVIALAGPAANLFTAAVLLVVMAIGKVSGLLKPAVVNVSLAVFNLLPIEPLDCGRAVRYRLMCSMNIVRAEKIAFVIGVVFLVPLSAMG